MNILITFEYPFHYQGFGGGHQIILGYARAFADEGHKVYVCSSGSRQMNIEKNSKFFHIPTRTFSSVQGLNLLMVGLFSIFLMRLRKIDCVICFGGESFMASLFSTYLKIPTFLYIAAPDLPIFSGYKSIRNHLSLYIQFLSINKFNPIVLTLSDYLSERIIQNWKINKSRVFKIGVGLDSSYLTSNTHAIYIQCPKKIHVVTIGRIAFQQKPLDQLLGALENFLPNLREWCVIGSGQDEGELKKLVFNSKISGLTNFMGTLQPREIRQQIQRADLVILPSTQESLMLTAYEAISQGKITILNDVADLKRDFNGYPSVIFSKSCASNDFLVAIEFAVNNYEILSGETQAASNHVKKLMSWEGRINKFSSLAGF